MQAVLGASITPWQHGAVTIQPSLRLLACDLPPAAALILARRDSSALPVLLANPHFDRDVVAAAVAARAFLDPGAMVRTALLVSGRATTAEIAAAAAATVPRDALDRATALLDPACPLGALARAATDREEAIVALANPAVDVSVAKVALRTLAGEHADGAVAGVRRGRHGPPPVHAVVARAPDGAVVASTQTRPHRLVLLLERHPQLAPLYVQACSATRQALLWHPAGVAVREETIRAATQARDRRALALHRALTAWARAGGDAATLTTDQLTMLAEQQPPAAFAAALLQAVETAGPGRPAGTGALGHTAVQAEVCAALLSHPDPRVVTAAALSPACPPEPAMRTARQAGLLRPLAQAQRPLAAVLSKAAGLDVTDPEVLLELPVERALAVAELGALRALLHAHLGTGEAGWLLLVEMLPAFTGSLADLLATVNAIVGRRADPEQGR